jgi:hypothetical protein
MSLKQNIVKGYRSTIGGLLMVGICFLYYYHYEIHLYYCIGGILTGLGLIVAPDQIVPLFVSTLKTLLEAVVGRIVGLIGKKK